MKLFYLTLQSTREGQAAYAHVHEIIDGLKRNGWEVILYEPRYRENKHQLLIERFWEFIRTQFILWFEYLFKRPSVIYMRWHPASWPTALLAHLLNVPVVQEVNGTYNDVFSAWPWTKRFRSMIIYLFISQLSWADSLVVVTSELKDWLEGCLVGRQIFVVPNGANVNLFSPGVEADKEVKKHSPYVIFFGALAPWQGIDIMIKAVNHPFWPPEVKLLIVGDGSLKAKIEKDATLNARIVYLGSQPYRRIPGLIVGSLAVLSPQTDDRGTSVRTGLFPLKLFEGMACGVPVIVSDFPGMADLVRQANCGLVIPPADSEALARAVAVIYGNKDMRREMGIRARESVIREHSWQIRAIDTARVLQTVTGKRSRSINN